MPIAVACRCGKKLSVRDELAGRKGKCPACGTVLDIPAAPKAAPSAPVPSVPAAAAPKAASPAAPPAAKPKAKVQPTSRVFKPDADLMREILTPAAPAPGKKAAAPAAGGAPAGGKTCPTCGAAVKAQEIFCVQCGSSLEQRAASTRGRRGDSAARAQGGERSPWLLRGIVAGVVAGPIVVGLAWFWISEAGKIGAWRERTQDGARIELDKDMQKSLDLLLNMESREKIRSARARISQDIEDMGSFLFDRRRVGYEELLQLVDLPATKSTYRPDRGWWSRRGELAKVEAWWEANRATLFWNARERRFSGRSGAGGAGGEGEAK